MESGFRHWPPAHIQLPFLFCQAHMPKKGTGPSGLDLSTSLHSQEKAPKEIPTGQLMR